MGQEVITGLYFKYLFIERDLTEFIDADVLLVGSSPAEIMKSQRPSCTQQIASRVGNLPVSEKKDLDLLHFPPVVGKN